MRTINIASALTTLLLLLFAGMSNAQEVLTLDRAIALALEHNHGIQIAANDVEAAKNNNNPGNAGLLPTVSASGSYNYSNNNTEIEFIGQEPQTINGAASTTLAGSLGLNYTIFNGRGTYFNFQRLQVAENLTEASSRLTVENTLIQVLNAYYTVAQAQDNLQTAQQSLAISSERLNRARKAAEFGTQSQLQVLNAQVDLNTDSIALVNGELNVNTARRNLNFLLGNKAPEAFSVANEVAFESGLTEAALLNEAKNNNASLLIAMENLASSQLGVKSSQANLYPVIGLNAAYGYTQNQNEASVVLSNTSVGFSGGLSLNWSLFNGNQRKTAIQNAKIALESSELQREQASLQVERDILNAWNTYQTRLAVLNAQETAVITAQRNFERTEQQFKLGQVTGTQFREAQLNLNRTQNQRSAARYQAKLSELECLRIAGRLSR